VCVCVCVCVCVSWTAANLSHWLVAHLGLQHLVL